MGKAKDGREMKAIQVLVPFNESKDSINYALVVVNIILITVLVSLYLMKLFCLYYRICTLIE